eukprot:gene2761-55065_t
MTLKEDGAELTALLGRLAAVARAGGAATDIADAVPNAAAGAAGIAGRVGGWPVKRGRGGHRLPLPALRCALLRGAPPPMCAAVIVPQGSADGVVSARLGNDEHGWRDVAPDRLPPLQHGGLRAAAAPLHLLADAGEEWDCP